MSTIPNELKYTQSHEWVRDNGDGTFTIGITDHAQAALGDIVFVETPEAGRVVAANEAVAVVESVKAASDIYSPLAGTVMAANTQLADHPDIINSSPYADGWIFQLTPQDMAELNTLLNSAAYAQVVADES